MTVVTFLNSHGKKPLSFLYNANIYFFMRQSKKIVKKVSDNPYLKFQKYLLTERIRKDLTPNCK